MAKSRIYIISYVISAILFVLIVMQILHFHQHSDKVSIEETGLSSSHDIVFGNNMAPINIYMYGNYKCPFCVKFLSDDLPHLLKDYDGKVKVTLKLVPFSNTVEELEALKMALAINKYGYYLPYHNLLLKSFDMVYTQEFTDYLSEVMLENEAIAQFYYSNLVEELINTNKQFFRVSNIQGTPTFIIDNQIIKGYIDFKEFKRFID